jgi:hypothetical protein
MSRAPFVYVALSRNRCADQGEFFGTHRVVAHKIGRKMARARLPVVAVARDISGCNRFMDGRTSMRIDPKTAMSDARELLS